MASLASILFDFKQGQINLWMNGEEGEMLMCLCMALMLSPKCSLSLDQLDVRHSGRKN